MSTARSVARGTTRLLAGVVSAKGLDFCFYLFLARWLGVEEFGRYTFALSFTLLFNIGADLGTTTIVTREVARHPERTRRHLGEALRVKGGLAAVTLIVALGAGLATAGEAATFMLIAVFVFAMLLNSTAFLFEGLLKAVGRAGAAGFSIAAQSLTALAVGLALVFSGWGALGGACAYLGGAVIHLLAAAYRSRDVWGRRAAVEPVPASAGARTKDEPVGSGPGASESGSDEPRRFSGALGLLREAAPLALSGAFIAIYFRIDAVLLKFFHGEAAVGYYGGAHRFLEGFMLLGTAFRSVLYPVMARRADGPSERLAILCRKSLRLHLMFTIGVAVFFTFQARTIVPLLLGESYGPAAPALALLMWALPGAFMADTLLHLLTAQRRQAVVAKVLGGAAAFNVVTNLVLIPRFSFLGSAATAIATEGLIFTMMFLAFRRSVPTIGFVTLARAPLLAGVMAAVALGLLAPLDPGGVSGLALMGLFAMVAYATALVLLGGLGRNELDLVQSLLPARQAQARSAGSNRRAS